MWLVVSLILLEIVAIFCAWRAVSTARTAQGSVAWAVFLITAPYVAVPAFLFLGHSKYAGYLVARRDSERAVDELARLARESAPDDREEDLGVTAFERLSNLPVVRGNDAKLLIDGKATFEAIFAAMDSAQSYLLVQFYIIKDDQIGREFRDRLIAAAKRGVRVRLLYDAVGCIKLPRRYLDELKEAGVSVMDIHRQRGPKFRFQINFRNHRKTVVADGKVGFIGGTNVGDEYLGRDPKFGAWRDTHLRIEGPVVIQLQLVFVEDWHWATDDVLDQELDWSVQETPANKTAMIMATGPGDTLETGALYFCNAITAARERCWIASPYFVPDRDVLSALKLAALRGVDVRIIVPDIIDHKMPWLAAFSFFDDAMEAGVQIWRYTDGFMHQKVVLVDDRMASIGTTNLDNRSFRLNFEATALIFDRAFTLGVAAMLKDDFSRCFRLTRKLEDQKWTIRVGAPIARLFAPLL